MLWPQSDKLNFDTGSASAVTVAGEQVTIGALRVRLLKAFLANYPDFCLTIALQRIAWGRDTDTWPDQATLRVHITHLRKILHKAGLGIENGRARGYRLKVIDDEFNA